MASEMRVGSVQELASKVMELIDSYDAEKHLLQMKQLTEYSLSEKQFAQLVGRAKLYGYLPKEQKLEIPNLLLNDGQISSIAKDYYQDERFCKNESPRHHSLPRTLCGNKAVELHVIESLRDRC